MTDQARSPRRHQKILPSLWFQSFTTDGVGCQWDSQLHAERSSADDRFGVIVNDPDGLNLSSATVSFANWQAGDRIQFNNTYSLRARLSKI